MAHEFYALCKRVEAWARDKGICDPNAQYVVVCEEVGEMLTAQTHEERVDGVGDALVTLIVLADTMSLGGVVSDAYAQPKGPYNGYIDTLYANRIRDDLLLLAPCVRKQRTDAAKTLVKRLAGNVMNYGNAYDIRALDALRTAFSVIENRKGRLVNGSFVKEADLQ